MSGDAHRHGGRDPHDLLGVPRGADRQQVMRAFHRKVRRGGHLIDPVSPDPRSVFVVHGRNLKARDAMFAFLRSLDLKPMEWNQAVGLTGIASPYIGQVLDAGFAHAQAVVVLMTPDEITYLDQRWASGPDDPDAQAGPQARANVLFEAGMALGLHPNRTVLATLGKVRLFSDIDGRHLVRLANDMSAGRRFPAPPVPELRAAIQVVRAR